MASEQKTALVIDDDTHVNDIVKRLLEREGYEVEAVFDGKAGLDLARDKDFDLIISDILMPGHEGITVLREIKGMDKKCKVVMISGGMEKDEYFKTAKEFGADGIIEKPIRVDEFRKIINSL